MKNSTSVRGLIGENARQGRPKGATERRKHHSSFSIRVAYVRTKLKN